MDSLSASLKLLSDATRLRLLRVLALEELNAGELGSILGKGQPAISRQVALLRDAGLVHERREGRYAFFTLSDEARAPGSTAAWVVDHAVDAPDDAGDLARLDDVRRRRSERELGDSSNGADAARSFVPGRSWRAWSRAVSFLVPRFAHALDLGCGEGALTLEIARFCDRVTGVDHRPGQIRRARTLAGKRRAENVTFVQGQLDAVDLPADAVDLVVLSQTLHLVDEPRTVLTEAQRVLRPEGRLVVLDLLPHDEAWVREQLGHRHLGFSAPAVSAALDSVGFDAVNVVRMPARPGDAFKVLVAAATASTAASDSPRNST